ncbi:ribonuclease HII [Desulfopila aestuarii]|uniref:Ribonuclease HII n=1 Tax=Desulfopila aestuarii DSM 18488 TaxID=1121416 RepID=A0A1M7YEL8_9BACT|nr:ribonuclease HII [Desulfopila aestuarii]SHO51053.1 RNase HII [Desulfopila aestuarii DSM 18488]
MGKRLFDAGEPSTSNFSHERALARQGFVRIAGCDEVGRGPLAGPVVAASVILPPDCDPSLFIDSKQLNHKRRLELYQLLSAIQAAIGIGIVSVEKIDEINILQASLLAMKRSVEQLANAGSPPDYILVDGKFEIPLITPQTPLIKGETKSGSIAAASIVAKVTRDAIMDTLDDQYPGYGLGQHKGYPTRQHRQAIAAIGPSKVHRKTFRGVKEFVR